MSGGLAASNMQTSTNTPRAVTGFDLKNRGFTDPLLSSMMRAGVAGYLPLLARAGGELVGALHLTPPRSGTDGNIPGAPGKQGRGNFKDLRGESLNTVRKTLVL